jgi:hypothetical protein
MEECVDYVGDMRDSSIVLGWKNNIGIPVGSWKDDVNP